MNVRTEQAKEEKGKREKGKGASVAGRLPSSAARACDGMQASEELSSYRIAKLRPKFNSIRVVALLQIS
jgi:hypothetical protein